jgi:hypothetical protein
MSHYLDWQDLLTADEQDALLDNAPAPAGALLTPSYADDATQAEVVLPDEITSLMAEQQRLRSELDALTGKAAPTDEDRRQQLRFPVKAHTKESRIEERRLHLRDEYLQMLKRRQLARQLQKQRTEQQRLQQIQLEAQNSRLQRRLFLRQQQQQQLRQLQALLEVRIQQRWQTQRLQALQEQNAIERQHQRWQQDRQLQRQQAQQQYVLQQTQQQQLVELREQQRRNAALVTLQQRRAENRALEQRLDARRYKSGE